MSSNSMQPLLNCQDESDTLLGRNTKLNYVGGLCLPGAYSLLMEKDIDTFIHLFVHSFTQHTFIVSCIHSANIYLAPTLGT